MKVFWLRYRFWINGFILLLPFWFLYQALTPPPLEPKWAKKQNGEFSAEVRPMDKEPPYLHDGEREKDFSVIFGDSCANRVKQAYLKVATSAPNLPDDDSGIVHGNTSIQHAHVPFPDVIKTDDRLWLTIQDWQGRIIQLSWVLEK
ncbi:hypothetical protein [Hydrogenovibrio kuenenii]|uniref:hypothetical protein n=1 Tax=Hydrogenovibrio kuenenii TaxID=63658 RepID=UPI000466A6DF|nr:hypothetical protein [Hydrogenovibrio kuenenii]